MKFKKHFALLLTCAAIAGQAIPTFAQTQVVVDQVQTSAITVEDLSVENIGVTPMKPSMIETKSTSKPTSSHNVATSGTMTFSGQAAYDALYTNKYFTGKSEYTITVKNLKSYLDDLTVEIYRSDGTYIDSISVQGQTSETVTLKNASTSSKYYLKFIAPSHFSGSVS